MHSNKFIKPLQFTLTPRTVKPKAGAAQAHILGPEQCIQARPRGSLSLGMKPLMTPCKAYFSARGNLRPVYKSPSAGVSICNVGLTTSMSVPLITLSPLGSLRPAVQPTSAGPSICNFELSTSTSILITSTKGGAAELVTPALHLELPTSTTRIPYSRRLLTLVTNWSCALFKSVTFFPRATRSPISLRGV